MISNAFKSAYTNKVSAQNQGIDTITGGVKALGTLALGIAGFSGALGSGGLATASKYALANKVGGIGGAIMLSTMEEKRKSAEDQQQMFSREEVSNTIQSQLGDNPINRAAIKKLSTVFEKLTEAKQSGIMNKEGNIDSSFGEIDPNSELGKKIIGGLE